MVSSLPTMETGLIFWGLARTAWSVSMMFSVVGTMGLPWRLISQNRFS
jgi:hypothetical protein